MTRAGFWAKTWQLMAQPQALVPGPLRYDLPGFLSPGRVATPAVGILLDVFVFQSRFKGTAMGGARDATSEAVKALWGRLVKKSSETTPSRMSPT